VSPRLNRKRPDAREERGATLVLFVLFLPVLLAFAAFVVDVGHAFQLRRHLQVAADAAALAAAQELPSTTNATTIANEYSASAGGRNVNPNLPPVATEVEFPSPSGAKVRVTQRATSRVFFAGIVGFSGFNVAATAVASRQATTGGSPLAVYVHELCGASTGNKGLIVNAADALIQGGIHVNGQFKISSEGFEAEAQTTVYRPTHPNSTPPPSQGSCDGSGSPKIENHPTARYCTVVCAPGTTVPLHGQWRDWVTPYHTADIVRARVNGGTCTHTPTGDVTLSASSFPGGVLPAPRFYCLPLDKKFTLDGAVKGRLTVIAGDITINTQPGASLRPFNDAEPVLFWARKSSGNGEVIVNPSGAFEWFGFVINRRGGINVNSGGVVSPREGLLEGSWVQINGENFTMLGRGPPSVGGTSFGGPILEE
jgi:Putative Flp pilus-assembly TadE/G-like